MATATDIPAPKRRLILRLSSLGDVILASTALQAPLAAQGVDWVVAKEFAPLLRGHPKIKRLHEFDRSAGIQGWIALCRDLHAQGYDEIHDLHRTLRTTFARVLFLLWGRSKAKGSASGRTRWWVVSKERVRFFGACAFKGLWPKNWRPTPWRRRYALCLGGTGDETPNLCHLVNPVAVQILGKSKNFLCLMPASRWPGKRWPVAKFAAVAAKTGAFPVVLGAAGEEASEALLASLKEAGVEYFSGVGKWDLPQVASVLASSRGLLTCDTGLAHLAEAVGVPALVLFGPTTPELGFGPWREESRSLEADLWCRPCGKDGRNCFRPFAKYRCLSLLSVDGVVAAVKQTLEGKQS